MDALMLARIQFAANITFHILFPAITIALCWILLFFKLRYDATGEGKWLDAYRFWVKVFALCFAIGVVSGVVMSFQFGTNWPGYMNTVGNIAGPLLAYEVLSAFFLEATFLGIMLFGTGRVSNAIHTLATVLVAVGTTLSAFWILALNSWMQTPAGFEMIAGKAHVTSWWAVLWTPSAPYRLVHMLLASGLTASFLVAGVSAYRWLRSDRTPGVMAALKTGVYAAAILIPLQIFAGDQHGLNTLEYQPQKVAAMEGIWETERGADLRLFAIPDEKNHTNHFEIKLPGLGSWILTHSADGEVKGLNDFPGNNPPVLPVFFGFRIMVGMGLLMLAVSWWGAWTIRKHGEPGRWLARSLVAMTFAGWIATVAGWYVTETGRQPWLVSGVLRTAEAVAPNVTAPMIGLSLAMYLALYGFLLLTFIFVVFFLARHPAKAQHDERQAVGQSAMQPAPAFPGGPLMWSYLTSADVLPVIFAGLMGLSILLYVILDGYDLGVGILMSLAEPEEKDKMIASIGPFWDANETWLVMGIGLLLVAFPAAHGIILTALYLPVAAMLGGLILRGVAFDFRAKAPERQKQIWDWVFFAGSLIAALSQGFMLGVYIVGFEWSFLNAAFGIICGVCLAAGYAFIGACWVVLKTEGELQRKAIRWGQVCVWLTAAGLGLVSLATPIVSARVFEKWFSIPNVFLLAPIPIATGALLVGLERLLRRMPLDGGRYDWLPFAGAASIFLLGFGGLAYSFYPYVVLDRLTVWQAASAPESLSFILVGVVIVLPFILAYTAYAYSVFWGKVGDLSYY